jgi:hypothetical protein
MEKTMEWRPIETAPRDGTELLGFWRYLDANGRSYCEGMRVISWDESWQGWHDDEDETHTYGAATNTGLYTHWMPLPPPPTVGETNE